MRSPVVVVLHIGSKHASKVLLVQHDHMVKRVSPDTADEPLTIRILPRRSRGYFDFFNAHVPHSILKRLSVDRVPIPQEITRCGVPWEGIHELLGRPLGGGVLGDIKMHDATTLVSQQDEHEEHSAVNGWHGEEITGDDILDMVGQKGPPRG
jgi:hypothetical protein